MDKIKIEISLEKFEKLFKSGHIKTGEYKVSYIEPDTVDYSHDETWTDLNSQSKKIYKKLKSREFDLRHSEHSE